MQRSEIVAEARTWLGTPYRHQHWVKGQGVDCVGLVVGVGVALGILDWSADAWAPFKGYGRTPNPRKMGEAMQVFLRPLDFEGAPPEGAIAWIGWREHLPMHLAIIGRSPDGRATMIHAFGHVGRVVEHGFAAEWPGRVVSWWDYPGV